MAKFLSSTLKDPNSAQFRWAPVLRANGDGSVTYCGQVNAKNSYGAYVGFKPFSSTITFGRGKIVSANLHDMEALGEYGVLKECRSAGLDPFAT